MKEFILFMYDDVQNHASANDGEQWEKYLKDLRTTGKFDGGSSIGSGILVRKGHSDKPSSKQLNGFIRVRAEGIDVARAYLIGNPNYEAGGTVEIRELIVEE